MFIPRLTVFLSIAVLFTLVACQGKSTPQPPAEVRDAVLQQLTGTGIEAVQIGQATGLFKPSDLTPQQAPDWLVDFSVLPSASICGTGGCPLQIWVKIGKSPYTLAFERQVLRHEAARNDKGWSALSVQVHGALCGGTGSDDCRYQFEWHGEAEAPDGYFAAASIAGNPMRYEGPLLQALPVISPAGSVVTQLLERYRAACAKVGATTLLDQALARIPDLTGDARPELLFDAGLADCQRENEAVGMHCAGETCRSQLFTEHGGEGWKTAWSGESFAYAIEFSRGGARLLIRAADCEKQCLEQTLSWQGETRRFALVKP